MKSSRPHLGEQERERLQHGGFDGGVEPVAEDAYQRPGDMHDGGLQRCRRRQPDHLAQHQRRVLLILRQPVEDRLAKQRQDRSYALFNYGLSRNIETANTKTKRYYKCANEFKQKLGIEYTGCNCTV